MRISKYYFILFAILLIPSFLVGCAATAPKTTIDYTDSVYFDEGPEIPLEQYSVIVARKGSSIITVNGVDRPRDALRRGDPLIIPPGSYVLIAEWFNRPGWRSDPINIRFAFEEGKYYYLDYVETHDKVRFFVTDLTDTELLERAKNSKATFSRVTPSFLKGVWVYSNRYPPVDTEINFIGNRFVIASFNRLSRKSSIAEGRYLINESTIVLFYEKQNDKNITREEVVNYELKEGALSMKRTLWGTEGFGTGGEYNKK